ncbi:LacI family DNA-binding transcriptional regulator [Shouchella patagoniensis]|uniref:LacI family DNA-binding transcriptional regulator n=1 Tax=Shouchella patagoniensis TaxID=228576 RepID=UPI000995691E|nr:LacI family DNA-binding transcriptional regulator [Shouchella patagoniensis]
MTVTIKDIAKAANVSYSTVSKALNDSPLVKTGTKRVIVEKAKELGYTPNFSAKHLVTRRSNTIGLVWPTIERAALSELVTHVNKQISKNGRSMILSINDALEAVELFSRMRIDGILLFEEDIAQDELPNNLGIPLLSYGVPGINQFPTLGVQHELAMELAVNELVEKGHREIVYVGIHNGIGRRQQAKQAGFEQAMKERGFGSKIVNTGGLNAGDAEHAVTQFLDSEGTPEAIICSSYDLTIGTLRALKRHQLSIPNDVSVISYDNIPQLKETEVPVTSVGVPIDALACALVEMLIDLIEKGEENVENRKLSPVLVKRKSVKIRN